MLGWVILLLFGTFPPLSFTIPPPRTVSFPHQREITGSLYPIITTDRIPSRPSLINSGAGPIGLVTALAAHAAGCTPIVLTDLVQSRLEFAKTLLPNIRTVQITKGQSPEEVAGMIKSAAGGMISVALECTGFESSIRTAIFVSHATKAGGLRTDWCRQEGLLGRKWRRPSAYGLGWEEGEQKRLMMARANAQSLKFGGKCFVIGVGPTDQGVSHSHSALHI
jgi:threonine dehydrogenase-like Zn-dependent dehydrogenase